MSGEEGEEREKQIHGGQKGRVQGQDARECSGGDETCTWTSGDGGSGDMKCPCGDHYGFNRCTYSKTRPRLVQARFPAGVALVARAVIRSQIP